MQLEIATNHYVTVCGSNIAQHEEEIKKAYASAKAKFKFAGDESVVIDVIDTDNQDLQVTVSVAGKQHKATRKGERWMWQDETEDEKNG